MTISRTLHVGKLQDGGWATATEESPYLFFKGDTEQEVVDLAKEALDFCFANRDEVARPPVRRPNISLSQFFKKKTEYFSPHMGGLAAAE